MTPAHKNPHVPQTPGFCNELPIFFFQVFIPITYTITQGTSTDNSAISEFSPEIRTGQCPSSVGMILHAIITPMWPWKKDMEITHYSVFEYFSTLSQVDFGNPNTSRRQCSTKMAAVSKSLTICLFKRAGSTCYLSGHETWIGTGDSWKTLVWSRKMIVKFNTAPLFIAVYKTISSTVFKIKCTDTLEAFPVPFLALIFYKKFIHFGMTHSKSIIFFSFIWYHH